MSFEGLICPRDQSALVAEAARLTCSHGHSYPIVQGVPVILLEEDDPTHPSIRASLDLAAQGGPPADDGAGADAIVASAIAATCGNLYLHLVGTVAQYPIPELRLPAGNGERFLELGCNWGRWCVSAARRGYKVTGVDPSLLGILAAKRVAEKLGVEAEYIVADARHLPFPDRSFDVVFSYSVLQHFSKDDTRTTLGEVGRVLRPGGSALIQLANRFGARSFFNRLRTGFKKQEAFDVRYWTPRELKETFSRLVGPSKVEVDGFFSLNAQRSDVALLRPHGRAIVYASDGMRRLATIVRPLEYLADSLYIRSRRPS